MVEVLLSHLMSRTVTNTFPVTFRFVYSQLAVSPSRILSQFLNALLILLSFKLTNFLKDFIALVFFKFSPNARDVQALSAALFSLDRECFTSLKPSQMSDASALGWTVLFSLLRF